MIIYNELRKLFTNKTVFQKHEKINLFMTLICVILFVSIVNIQNLQKKMLLIQMTIVFSIISRIYQYHIVIRGLCEKKFELLNFITLFTCYISHFILFFVMYELNFYKDPKYSFYYQSNEFDVDKKFSSSYEEFEKEIDLNLFYYTFSLSFGVGNNTINARNKFGKIIGFFHMFDGIFLFGFLISKLFKSLRNGTETQLSTNTTI